MTTAVWFLLVLVLMRCLISGLILGWLFYQGLWWTVRRGLASRHPATWFLVSLLVRMVVVVAGVILVAQGDWRRLLACLAGVALGRVVVSWRVRAPLVPAPVAGGGGAP